MKKSQLIVPFGGVYRPATLRSMTGETERECIENLFNSNMSPCYYYMLNFVDFSGGPIRASDLTPFGPDVLAGIVWHNYERPSLKARLFGKRNAAGAEVRFLQELLSSITNCQVNATNRGASFYSVALNSLQSLDLHYNEVERSTSTLGVSVTASFYLRKGETSPLSFGLNLYRQENLKSFSDAELLRIFAVLQDGKPHFLKYQEDQRVANELWKCGMVSYSDSDEVQLTDRGQNFYNRQHDWLKLKE